MREQSPLPASTPASPALSRGGNARSVPDAGGRAARLPQSAASPWSKRLVLGLATLLVLLVVGLVMTVLPLGIGSRIFEASVNTMEPTVAKGDYVYVNLRAYRSGTLPAHGDLVILNTGDVPAIETRDGKTTIFLERVVGLPGETIGIVGGKLTVNGSVPPALEGLSYVTFAVPGGGLTHEGATFTVPPDSVYVLGDNTKNSYDSRFWGPAPLKALRGKVESCMWPPARMRPY